MIANNRVTFLVGYVSVSMEIDESGEVVYLSAADAKGVSYDVSFGFAPNPVNGGCISCEWNGRRWVCQAVPCGALDSLSAKEGI